MSNRMKAATAMIVYMLGTSYFFGWLLSGNNGPAVTASALFMFLVAQAAAVYILLLVQRTE